MADEPMTLLERLRNPSWENDFGDAMQGKPAQLNIERTTADMLEAAKRIEALENRCPACGGDGEILIDDKVAQCLRCGGSGANQ